MTAAGLRREGARGKLIIERIAGKDYTTLANIDRMRELCRVEVRERACGCENPNMTRPVNSRTRQSGSSRTGATEKARDAALRIAEGEYIARQHLAQAESGLRPPAAIPVADVLSLYGRDIAPKHARRGETGQRITALLSFFGDKFLSDINGQLCRAYVEHRGSEGAARRELEDRVPHQPSPSGRPLLGDRRGGPARCRASARAMVDAQRGCPLDLGRLAVPRGAEGVPHGPAISPAHCPVHPCRPLHWHACRGGLRRSARADRGIRLGRSR
jgi:hypothetical protein